MTRKSSRKTQRSRKPVKRSRKPVKRSRKPVKRSRKPVKRSRKPVKRSRKPVKRSRKPVKRSRKPVKRSRKPVKRSRKPVKFKMLMDYLVKNPSLLTRLKSGRSIPGRSIPGRSIQGRSIPGRSIKPGRPIKQGRPKGVLNRSLPEKDNIKNIWIEHYLDQIPLWVLQTVRTYPSQPHLSDKITKKNLATILSDNQMLEDRINHYLFTKVKDKYWKTP